MMYVFTGTSPPKTKKREQKSHDLSLVPSGLTDLMVFYDPYRVMTYLHGMDVSWQGVITRVPPGRSCAALCQQSRVQSSL